MTDYADLLPYCRSETQKRHIEALIEHGSLRKAAKALGQHPRRLSYTVKRVRRYAAQQGYAPEHDMTHPAPEGYLVRGVSTYYDADGRLRGQWVKTQVDQARRDELLAEALKDAFEEYDGASHRVRAPRSADKELLAVYPMGDPHIGMYAWAEEAGEDFDSDIASRQLRAAVRDLVSRAPQAHTALLLNLGDFFHADTLDNVTRRNNHPLDVDTRWSRILRIGVDLMIECVYAALEHHKTVVVRNMIGNHDDHSSLFLSIALERYFSNERRVKVDSSPAHFWYYRHGAVLIGSTHGNTCKPDQLPGIMAADRPEDWGATRYRYWYTGHIHHRNVQEFPGVLWESFRTLAARDAYHAAAGYRSGRDMHCIIHHAEYGEVARNIVNVEMLRDQ